MEKLTDKEIISLLLSLIQSGDLKVKTNIKDNVYEYIATSTLTYKNRKIFSAKNSMVKKGENYDN